MKYKTKSITIQAVSTWKLKQREMVCQKIQNKNGTILELFAGKGILTEKLYKNYCKTNIMIEKENYVELDRFKNDDRYKIFFKSNTDYIKNDLDQLDDLTLVDFDAFGTPIPTIKSFFEKFQVKKPFFLCLTDGNVIKIRYEYQNKERLLDIFQRMGYVTEYKKLNSFLLMQKWLILTLKKIAKEHNFNVEKINMMNNQSKGAGSTIYMGFEVKP